MKCLSIALLVLLGLQAAVANPVYATKKPVYVPVPVPSPPAPKPVTVTCTPKPVTSVVAANVSCGVSYTLSSAPSSAPSSAYEPVKKTYICSRQVCADPAKPVYAPVYAVKGKHYYGGKAYAVATPAPAPVVYTKPVYVAPSPSPSPVPACKIEYAAPIYACATGYTLSGSSCLLTVPGPCPATYTASAGVCTYTYMPTDPKKPVYVAPTPAHYFFGKMGSRHAAPKYEAPKYEAPKYEAPAAKPVYAPAGPAYCDDALYAKPSPSPVVYTKPVYSAPAYDPKKSYGSLFKHGL